jgi:hypothetical protein
MPIAPDAPFPKTAGHIVRSKDWNDLVVEVQRLDNAKVNRAGADAIAGPLTIAGALTANSTVTIAGTLTVNSAATVFGALSARSTLAVLGATTLSSTVAVTGATALAGALTVAGAATLSSALSVAGALNVSGNVGVGVVGPGLKLEVSDRIRLRQGPNGDAGMWLFQTVPNADRAFIGMANNDEVGFFGASVGWGLRMHVISGDVLVAGRMRDAKVKAEAAGFNSIQVSSLSDTQSWSNIPNLSLTVVSPAGGAWFNLRFNMNGVQAEGVTQAHAEFRLLVDGGQWDFTVAEFHQNGWELRGIRLERIGFMPAGAHTILVQWGVHSPQAHPQAGVFIPEVRVTLTGCYYGDTRFLSAVEL